ncbi:sensor histidine kinase [Dyadobacter pollutisoli]|uniref:Histidine kinase n=1 Tax=Dyadobacter pollutisoli TaxID=2910158 RepID=A0A9E8NAK0_9BACT|nr:sensor histidine kinase [Dyadobacter pollutisoli]WAC13060.1 histidine kinase [Dyadobacter pollutisoli]
MSRHAIQLLALLLIACNIGFAQLPNISFDHITDRDGLPSRTVECALEDTSGFMWFGTRKSLSRYDGYTFQRVGNKWVHGLAMDRAGTVYYSSGSERLVRVDALSRKERSIAGPAEGGAFNTFVDSFGNVWFSDRDNINRYDPANGKTYVYRMKKTTYIYHKGSFAEDSHRNVWVLGMEVGLFQFDRKANRLVCKIGLDCPIKNEKYQFQMHRGFIDKQDKLWVAIGQGILKYDIKTGQIKIYKRPNFSLLTVCEGTDEEGKRIFWVGSESGLGVFRPETEQFHFFKNLIPQQYTVYNIVLSPRSGILWVCTSEGLLKYNPHNQFIKTNHIAAGQQPVNAILNDKSDPTGQTFWMAVAYQGLYKWNLATNQITHYKFPQYSELSEAKWLIQDKNNILWVGCNQWQSWQDGKGDASDNRFEGIFRFDPVAEKYLPMPFTLHHAFFSVPFYSLGIIDSKERFWLINHYESIHVFDPKNNREINLWSKEAHAEIFANGNWVMDVFEDSRSHIWLTTYQGIFHFDEPTRTFRKTKTGTGLLKMTEGPDGNLWVVGWAGLIKLNKEGEILKTWSDKDGLYDLECHRVFVDIHNRVWIGTFDGLHLFDEKSNTFRRFTVNDGLLSNNTMMGLCPTGDDKLLVGNVGGWNVLDMAALDRSQVAYNTHLTNVRVNNKDRMANWSKHVSLGPHENAVSFNFSALNYRKPNDNHYAYYLEGFEKNWIDAGQDHQAFYTNLAAGDYVFHARSAGVNAGQELQVPFVIKPAFYETRWFRLLMLLTVLGLVGYIYQNQLSYQTIKAKLELEELTLLQKEAKYNEEVAAYQLKLSETEMASLRSQMNPHFIFNCLNSIQFFTAQNDAEKASDYLTKFSRLIRLVLENSKSEQVSLENELETLRLYIEMEAMRFPGKLHYKIQMDEGIDAGLTQIPPLLLQPFVENAIWHGLMQKEAGGTVRIALTQPGPDLLRVEITDDGIGRQKASDYKSKSATKSKSYGIKITADRIELINQLFQVQTSVQIMDLTDQQGLPAGTKVVLSIPV